MSQLRVFGAQPAFRRGDEVADLFAQATAHHRAGQFAKAQAGYKKVLKKRPNHFNALQMLAVSEHQSGNFQSAERLLRRALLVDPQSAAARCDLGVVLAALQRPDEALACYDGLIALKPDFVNAHLNRGNLLLRLKRFAEAVTSYDNVAYCLGALGRAKEALPLHEQSLAIRKEFLPDAPLVTKY